jgi:hypothetical protein
LHTEPRVHWYLSVWFWWAVLAAIMGLIYWRFW